MAVARTLLPPCAPSRLNAALPQSVVLTTPYRLSTTDSRNSMPTEEELYQEHILDHYEDPFHRGHLPTATHAHEDKNPLCGDVVRMELEIDGDGKISNVFFDGQGCVISQASASMLAEEMFG